MPLFPSGAMLPPAAGTVMVVVFPWPSVMLTEPPPGKVTSPEGVTVVPSPFTVMAGPSPV